ncbi:MAG: Na+/H+ antiporter subunit E [Acidimicrobiales bacterium]
MRSTTRIVWLLVFWLLAWGEISAANVASGLLLGTALLVAFPPRRRPTRARRVSALGTARLIVYVIGQLVTSNLVMAREILSPHSRIRSGVLAYQVRDASDEVLTLIANIIALTPGAMTVEASRTPAVIYVHFLFLHDVDEARRGIARLERLVVAALGGPSPIPVDASTSKEGST